MGLREREKKFGRVKRAGTTEILFHQKQCMNCKGLQCYSCVEGIAFCVKINPTPVANIVLIEAVLFADHSQG